MLDPTALGLDEAESRALFASAGELLDERRLRRRLGRARPLVRGARRPAGARHRVARPRHRPQRRSLAARVGRGGDDETRASRRCCGACRARRSSSSTATPSTRRARSAASRGQLVLAERLRPAPGGRAPRDARDRRRVAARAAARRRLGGVGRGLAAARRRPIARAARAARARRGGDADAVRRAQRRALRARAALALAAPAPALARGRAHARARRACEAAMRHDADSTRHPRRAAAHRVGARAGGRASAAGAPVRGARRARAPTSSTTAWRACCRPPACSARPTAAALLADAIGAGSRICVVADYDCDGATACAVVLRGLRLLGADPATLSYVVPDRRIHGYGLTPQIVDLALEREAPDVLLTVDNGIASLEGVAHARRAGLAVVITDHHLPASVDGEVALPDADVHRQSEPAGLQLREQAPRRRRRRLLRAAGAARRAARARRVRTSPSSRGSMRCSTWSRSAPSPTSSASIATTAAWSRRA